MRDLFVSFGLVVFCALLLSSCGKRGVPIPPEGARNPTAPWNDLIEENEQLDPLNDFLNEG